MSYVVGTGYCLSDSDWLGQVPSHWTVKRIKYLATINDEVLPETTDPSLEISYVDIGNVNAVSGIVATEDLQFDGAPGRDTPLVRNGEIIVPTVRSTYG